MNTVTSNSLACSIISPFKWTSKEYLTRCTGIITNSVTCDFQFSDIKFNYSSRDVCRHPNKAVMMSSAEVLQATKRTRLWLVTATDWGNPTKNKWGFVIPLSFLIMHRNTAFFGQTQYVHVKVSITLLQRYILRHWTGTTNVQCM